MVISVQLTEWTDVRVLMAMSLSLPDFLHPGTNGGIRWTTLNDGQDNIILHCVSKNVPPSCDDDFVKS